MNVATAPTSITFARPARTPGTAITIAVASAAKDPSFSDECVASTVKTTHGISARKMPLPPPLGSALSLLLDDMEVSFRLT
jgi:hypothetical protein